MTHRIEVGRVLTQTYEHSSLFKGEIARFFAKIGVGSSLDAYSIMQEIELVEIHHHDFLLGEVALQFDGYHPLYGFL